MKGSLSIFLNCGAINTIDVTKEEADKVFSAIKFKKRYVELDDGSIKSLWKTDGIAGVPYRRSHEVI